MDIKEFDVPNPAFDNNVREGKLVKLKLPPGKLAIFKIKKQEIWKESMRMLLEEK